MEGGIRTCAGLTFLPGLFLSMTFIGKDNFHLFCTLRHSVICQLMSSQGIFDWVENREKGEWKFLDLSPAPSAVCLWLNVFSSPQTRLVSTSLAACHPAFYYQHHPSMRLHDLMTGLLFSIIVYPKHTGDPVFHTLSPPFIL